MITVLLSSSENDNDESTHDKPKTNYYHKNKKKIE